MIDLHRFLVAPVRAGELPLKSHVQTGQQQDQHHGGSNPTPAQEMIDEGGF
jgi:hypothetical protein